MLGLTSSSMSHMWVGRLKRLPVLVLWMFRMFSQLSGQENSTIVFRILLNASLKVPITPMGVGGNFRLNDLMAPPCCKAWFYV